VSASQDQSAGERRDMYTWCPARISPCSSSLRSG